MVLHEPRFTKHLIQSILDLKVETVEILDGTQFRSAQTTDDETKVFYTQVDVLAKLQDKTQVIIEIQVEKQKSFLQRIVIYFSEQNVENFEQAKKEAGDTHTAYQLVDPVYVISILSKNYFNDEAPFHKYKLIDDEGSNTPFTDNQNREIVNFAFIELSKYDPDKLTGARKHWFQFWSNRQIDNDADEEIQEADALLNEANWQPEVKKMIQREDLRREDYKAVLINAKEEAREEGRDEGREEGRDEEKIQIALKMLKRGLPISDISDFTGLTLEEIKQIQKDNNLL